MAKIIRGTNAADVIKVLESGVTVYAGGGNDTVHLKAGTGNTANGQDGNDTIYVHAGTHVVSGGAGNDILVTWGDAADGSRFEGGAGNDSFKIKGGNNHTIITGDGELNTVNLDKGSRHIITGGNVGVDRLFICRNDVRNVTANLQNGENRATLWGGVSNMITGGEDTDIFNIKGGTQNTLYGGAGKDYLVIHAGEKNSLYGGDGNDSLTVWQGSGDMNYLYGEGGNDTIEINGGNEHRINGGDGYNTVKLKGGNRHTYTGGNGKDIVYISSGNRHVIDAGDGSNKVTVYAGDDHTITCGSNTDVADIKGGSGVTVRTGSGKDYINFTAGNGHKAYGGDGGDVISVTGGENHLLYGDNGADYLYGNSGSETLYGGEGDDNLYAGSGDDNLYGGTGKDTFWFDSGNDIIFDFESGKDKIRLLKSELIDYEVSGRDSILTLSNSGTITLKNIASRRIDYADADGNSSSVIPVATQQSVIKSFMQFLDNYPAVARTREAVVNALGAAASYASNGLFPTWDALLERFISDVRNYGGSLSDIADDAAGVIPGSGLDEFLKNYCGIDLNNEDTGAITGADAGGQAVKTAVSIVPENGAIMDLASPPLGGETVINGLTFSWPNVIEDEKRQFIADGLNTWWVKEGLDLIEKSYGLSFKENDVTGNKIKVSFVNGADDDSFLAKVTWGYRYICSGDDPTNIIFEETHDMILEINMKYFDTIDTADVNGNASSANINFDRIIAHELTHATLGATMGRVYNLATPIYFKEGIAELTHGIDDFRTYNIMKLATTEKADRLARVLEPNVDGGDDSYAAGYMLLRYFAKYAAENYESTLSSNSLSMPVNSVTDSIAASASFFSSESTTAVADAGNDLTASMAIFPSATLTSLDSSGSALFGTASYSGLFSDNKNNLAFQGGITCQR